MKALSIGQTALLVAGILLVVIGGGMFLEGQNQKEAAEEWDSELRICGSAPTVEQARQIDCPDNPYSGGGDKMLFGAVLIVIGGIAARFGTG